MKQLLAATVFAALLVPVRAADPVVVLETSLGTIKVELYPDKAPATVKNFLTYVDDGFYDNTLFHRVIGKENSKRDFMVQCGGFDTNRREKKTRPPIKNEAGNGLSNKRGTLAMARTDDPDSASAQFFINVIDNPYLDRTADSAGYTVFGKVIDGMDVVDKIKAVKTGVKMFSVPDPDDPKKTLEQNFPNVPVEDLVIKSARRVPDK